MGWLELFQKTLDRFKLFRRQYPDNGMLLSIEIQLQYLVDLEAGTEKDRERLKDINLGVIAVREVEDRDENLANQLYEVATAAKQMLNE